MQTKGQVRGRQAFCSSDVVQSHSAALWSARLIPIRVMPRYRKRRGKSWQTKEEMRGERRCVWRPGG